MAGCEKTLWECTITVVRKTFEEVLDVLVDWHEKGYKLVAVKWNSDTYRYYISGERKEWREG